MAASSLSSTQLAMTSLVLSGLTLLVVVVVGILWWFRRRNKQPTRTPLVLPLPPVGAPVLLSPEPGASLKGPFNVPSFGTPSLEKYRASDYEEPLACSSCSRPLVDDENFYFIPLPEQPPGSGLGVCTLCHGKVV